MPPGRKRAIAIDIFRDEIMAVKDEIFVNGLIVLKSEAIRKIMGEKLQTKGSNVYTYVICNRYNITQACQTQTMPWAALNLLDL